MVAEDGSPKTAIANYRRRVESARRSVYSRFRGGIDTLGDLKGFLRDAEEAGAQNSTVLELRAFVSPMRSHGHDVTVTLRFEHDPEGGVTTGATKETE